MKAKTKGKAADIRRSAVRTGGGPNKLAPLNDIEQRVIGLISHIAVEGHQEALLPNPVSLYFNLFNVCSLDCRKGIKWLTRFLEKFFKL